MGEVKYRIQVQTEKSTKFLERRIYFYGIGASGAIILFSTQQGAGRNILQKQLKTINSETLI